jgi:tRNA pseudouridine55 synthase
MSFLLRTRSGSFTIDESFSIPELALLEERNGLSTALMSVETALMDLHAVHIEKEQEKSLLNGCALAYPAETAVPADALYRIYGENFLGVGAFTKDGLKMKIQF